MPVARDRRRRARPWPKLAVAALLAWPPAAPAMVPAPEPPADLQAPAVPGLPDLLHGGTLVFTRRLGPGGGTVAFRFTPREVTSRGRLVGDLAYDGSGASGTVPGVLATPRLDGEGGCGRLALALDPVGLPGLAPRAVLAPVAVDLTRAPGTVGRVAGTLCKGAADLVGLLRDLDGRLRDLAPRD